MKQQPEKKKKVKKAKKVAEQKQQPEKKKSGTDFGLNPKQALFCEVYATSEEFFGHGAKSYMNAYNTTSYMAAMSSASDLLKNTKILEYINYLLELGVLNDGFVDKQLALLITQNADPKTKIAAIREYNALKQRVTKKVELGATDELKDWMEKMNKILDEGSRKKT